MQSDPNEVRSKNLMTKFRTRTELDRAVLNPQIPTRPRRKKQPKPRLKPNCRRPSANR